MQKNPAQQFEIALREALESTPFPLESLPHYFHIVKEKALMSDSMATLGCDLETLKNILNKGDYNCYEVSFIINSLQAKTPTQLKVDLKEYEDIQTDIQDVANKWNEITGPIKASVMRKISVTNNLTKGTPKMAIGKA